MANVSLIRSLDVAYDSFVISALKAKGYTVNEFAFADSQTAFAANDPVIICGAYDCAAKTATYANDFLLEDYELTDESTVKTEVTTGKIADFDKDGRIDILIELKFKGSNKILPIIILIKGNEKNG